MEKKIDEKSEVTQEKLEKYFSITKQALDKLKICVPKDTHMHKVALDFLDMAQRYFSDAKFHEKNGDKVVAFASLNYAHGWLDAGARLGVFDVEHDSYLFTVD
ncbi:MAG: DUF357 domain-containing protein [Candidatus Nanoarchaeia archaeon]|nr:DUF357 domain-containing protein [Candidatus Nanoarchaeia archaeon]